MINVSNLDMLKITDFVRNDYPTDARWLMAQTIEDDDLSWAYSEMSELEDALGYTPEEVLQERNELDVRLEVAVRAAAINAEEVLSTL